MFKHFTQPKDCPTHQSFPFVKHLLGDGYSFHKGGRIQELIEAKGCHLLYLPPYSPDFNRIERWWARMKRIARRLLEQGKTLREAVESALCCLSIAPCA